MCTVIKMNIIVYLSLSFILQGLRKVYKKTEFFKIFTVAKALSPCYMHSPRLTTWGLLTFV